MENMKRLRAAHRKYGAGKSLKEFAKNYLNGPAIIALAHASAKKSRVSKRKEKAPKAKK